MRVFSSLFSCVLFTITNSSAIAETTTVEPRLGSAVLLGVDENYPGTATADFADPVLGSVVIQIAASSDSGALTVSTTSSTELRGAAPDDDQKIPRELSSYDPERREIWMQGPGYIRVQSADGQFRYLRRAALFLNDDYFLCTADGCQLQPQIKLPFDCTSYSISHDGAVTVITVSHPDNPSEIGRIKVYQFANPHGLTFKNRLGFSETSDSGAAIEGTPGNDGLGILRQRLLAAPNENVLTEMIRWAITR